MIKLLVNAPNGAQELVEVGDGGGYFDPARVVWDERTDGQLPEITLGGMVRSGAALVFDPARMDATIAATLGPARERAWERIKAERDRRKSLGVKVGAHWYHSDADSRIQQLSLFVMGASVPPVQWKTLTLTPPPVFVEMTPALAQGIFTATAASDAAVFAAAEVHRVAMEAMPDPENYDCSGGWPASIEDAR